MKKNQTHNRSSNSTYSSESNTIVKAFKEAESIASKIGDIFDEGAGNVLTSFQAALGYVQEMVALVQSIGDMISIFDSILSFVPGGSIVAGILSGGGRANGGPVNNAIPYLVGELGPEIFIPQTDGVISPIDSASAYISAMSSGSYSDNDFISAGSSTQSVPEITVIVQSEVERSKAMKFFSNHFPAYQNRQDKGSLR